MFFGSRKKDICIYLFFVYKGEIIIGNKIVSLLFTLCVYHDLLIKSIPMKNFDQNVSADVVAGFDY